MHPAGSGSHANVSTVTQPATGPAIGAVAPPLPEAAGHEQGPSHVAAAPFPWVVEALLPVLVLIWFLLLAAAMRRRRHVQPESGA